MTVVGIPILKGAPPQRSYSISWPAGKIGTYSSYSVTWSNDSYVVADGLGVLTMTAAWNNGALAWPSLDAFQANGNEIANSVTGAGSPRTGLWAFPDGYDSFGVIPGGGGVPSPQTFKWSYIPQSVLDGFPNAYLTVGGMVGSALPIDIIST